VPPANVDSGAAELDGIDD